MSVVSYFHWNKTELLKCTQPRSAFLYYSDYRLNLLTGHYEATGMDRLCRELAEINITDYKKSPYVVHFYFEAGFYLHGMRDKITEDTPLAMVIDYGEGHYVSKKRFRPFQKNFELKYLQGPLYSEYKKQFEKVYNHLLNGDCYQINLTHPYEYFYDKSLNADEWLGHFLSSEKLSPYAHATYIQESEQLILSNSPECLVQKSNSGDELFAMPIKGTVRLKDENDGGRAWSELKESEKNEGELFMITDLLRNDLNFLSKGKSKVVALKKPLHVPGLVHQYSIVSAPLMPYQDVYSTLLGVFPGGSITGTPKKRVMDYIHQIEMNPRGLYCGSTLLMFEKFCGLNINIRTADISLIDRHLKLGAGGGLTLRSRPSEEFLEMKAKADSFLTLFLRP
jgi:para-aminobenzoate synthetase component 1